MCLWRDADKLSCLVGGIHIIGKGVKNSINIMVEATAVHAIQFMCLDSCNSSSGDVFLGGDSYWSNCKSWAFL